MMGFPAAKLWQNETFHCHTNQMNISTSWFTNGEGGSILSCQLSLEGLG
jgi:hypothetical protein